MTGMSLEISSKEFSRCKTCPVKECRQPEASLACEGNVSTKRRQHVLKPCDGVPKFVDRCGPRFRCSGDRSETTVMALVVSPHPGS